MHLQILGFFIISCIFVGSYCGCNPPVPPKPCDVLVRCSDEEAPVWTTSDNRFCEVFRNACILRSQNCERLKENKPQFKEIPKSKCQQLCREQVCLAVFQPVCGIYNERYRTFGNDCEMKRHICTTGETYILYGQGACPE